MNHQRPVNLDLGTMKFPPMAIVSILHRLSGLILFLLLPVILYLLNLSLKTPESFTQVKMLTEHPYYRFILLCFGSAFIYHILAGIRHMLMDLGLGETLHAGKRNAYLVMLLALVLSVLLGVWLW
ncbi:MAG: succinate dehydrogenase, cytochrome b556 subunit [Legionellales bacterium]|nr:succinate dehydrogenase, cytochrome b556 subunit [Legionellales bacterium]